MSHVITIRSMLLVFQFPQWFTASFQTFFYVMHNSYSQPACYWHEETQCPCARWTILPPRKAYVQSSQDEEPKAEDVSVCCWCIRHWYCRAADRCWFYAEKDCLWLISFSFTFQYLEWHETLITAPVVFFSKNLFVVQKKHRTFCFHNNFG